MWTGTILAGLALAPCPSAAQVDSVPALIRAGFDPLPAGGVDKRAVMRQRSVALDVGLVADLAVGGRFALEPFAGESFELDVADVRDLSPTTRIASGTPAGDEVGYWSLAVVQGVAALVLQTGSGRLFHVQHHADIGYVALERDPHGFGTCPGGRRPEASVESADELDPGHDHQHDEPMLPEGGSTVADVLILYTPAAKARAGGALSFQAQVQADLANMNVALANSLVSTTVNLVGVLEVDYDESGNTFGTHLSRISDHSDGFLDDLDEWRAYSGADMVHMFVDDDDGGTICGLAFLLAEGDTADEFDNLAVGIDDVDCLGTITLAHELGHNMGLDHDIPNAFNPPVAHPQAHGFSYVGASGTTRNTIMFFQVGNNILNYSNPNVVVDGFPTGTPFVPFVNPLAEDCALELAFNQSIYTDYTSSKTKPQTVFVDFQSIALLETGSFVTPFTSLEKALVVVAPGGTIVLRGDPGTQFWPAVAQGVRLEVDEGPVVLGD